MDNGPLGTGTGGRRDAKCAKTVMYDRTYGTNRAVKSVKAGLRRRPNGRKTGVCGLAKAQAVVQNDDVLLR